MEKRMDTAKERTMLSILVPVYGVEAYIGQCAESLFGQTYADIEYIFVNDCTRDGSIAVLQKAVARHPERASQVRIIHHERNRGVGAARATALYAATGRYFMFVDSDDDVPKDAAERLMKPVQTTDVDIVEGAYEECFGGQVLRRHAPFRGSTARQLQLLLCHNIVANRLWGRIYRRGLFAEHGIGFTEGIDYAEDFGVVARALLHCRSFVAVDEVVYRYRQDNAGSYTHQMSEKNILSLFRSEAATRAYIEQHAPRGRYATALQIGAISCYREARRNGVSTAKADEMLAFSPRGVLPRCCIWLLRKGCPLPVFNLVYLSWRRIFATFAS